MAATSVGQIGLDLVVNQNQFKQQMSGIGSLAKKAGAALAAAFAVKKIVAFGKSCADLGSDLAEVQNVVDVTFPAMTAQVNEFAKSAAESFGLSETMAKRYTGTFGAMAKAFGFSESAAYDMSSSLTGLAGDVASFYNISQDEAYTKLKSVFTGETETLKDLGVVMTQNALDAYAMANGYGKVTAKMSEAEKVALRFAFVQDKLSAATGDFARTSDSWANQTRILTLRFQQLKATLGQGFIALFNPILKGINAALAGLQRLADGFTNFVAMLTGTDISGSGAISGIGSDALDAAENIGGIGDAAEAAAKQAEKSLAGFDQINKIAEPAESSSSGGTTGGTGGGGAGNATTGGSNVAAEISGFAEKALQLLKPLREIDFSNLVESFNNLKKALEPFTDKLFAGLEWAYFNLFVPLAKWTVEDVLPAFLDLLSGALELLNSVLDTAMPALKALWDNFLKPIAEWTGGIIVGVLEDLAAILKAIAENDACVGVITGVLGALVVNKGMKALDVLLAGIGTKLAGLGALGKVTLVIAAAFIGFEAGKWLNELITGEKFDLDLNDYIGVNFDPDEWIQAIQYTWDDICSWCNTNIAQPVKDFFTGIWDGICSTFENIGNWFKEKFTSAWEGIKGAFANTKEFFTTTWEGICEVFTNVGDWFSEKFSTAWDGIKGAFANAGAFFTEIWDGICNIFGNVAGWFKDRFSAAWEAVKNVFSSGGEIFSGIKDGILSGLKTVINALIKGINKVVSIPFNGINSALNGLKKINILGAKPFSWLPTITVPQIPLLAQGGYVKPNTPQLAMIGDNRHQGEVVAPEDKLRAMALEAAKMSGSSASAEQITQILQLLKQIVNKMQGDGTVIMQVGDAELARVVTRAQAKYNRRYNRVIIEEV